jgi:hypothetical protein
LVWIFFPAEVHVVAMEEEGVRERRTVGEERSSSAFSHA